MAAGDGVSRSLQETPSWALATVCFIFISLSIFIEHLIHLLANWLRRHKKTALLEAVEKLKSGRNDFYLLAWVLFLKKNKNEVDSAMKTRLGLSSFFFCLLSGAVLMLLGFMSLILAVTQKFISKICIPNNAAYTMLPCRKIIKIKTTKALGHMQIWTHTFQNWLSSESSVFQERRLAAQSSESSDYCSSKDMTSLISPEGMNQLSIFIFVLAVMQIVYSVLTMALGRAKMRRWKAWEKETQTIEYQAANVAMLQKCFFRQFFHSVAKVDYLTLRHGFIAAHLSINNKTFNFQKYIQRSLEDDFKVVVGISPVMWFIVVIFILLDVHGWHAYLSLSFLPLLIVLVLGTKLEVIVARMALKLKDKNSTIKGTPLVQPNDDLFWFSHPKFVLTLLHLTLFMNAFELAFFVWVTLTFGLKSCYHERIETIIIRVVLAVTVQVLCSYITLPLYALVTQMGTNFKSAVLEEQTANVIRQWHATVKQKRKKQKDHSQSLHDYSTTTWGSSRTSPHDLSPHRRSPNFSTEITAIGTESETIPDHQQEIVVQDEHTPADHTVSSIAVQIEMPEISISRT
ncbi:MLO-like protein 3 [Vitis vinifera]|uniref:MLO-like protein n=2 Tax=Vitis vinifera TaxID=29760 RepID=A0A438IL29_VITVI|nr:MLO-like protein 3 [Vitis vinifera]